MDTTKEATSLILVTLLAHLPPAWVVAPSVQVCRLSMEGAGIGPQNRNQVLKTSVMGARHETPVQGGVITTPPLPVVLSRRKSWVTTTAEVTLTPKLPKIK